ncbi:uncharacterized protein ARMOST_22504 [Armillaria ostoyae]|uniref:Uncharacterized protein n=1 Tax=Armillaria ostoyae TaxID=47428 RepID=A0A284SD18_ARMOS|nr:uncharacterized protein ARMOST_22504 [Armillaria ostoyae]
MASSYDLEGGNHPDHSHSTTSSPTLTQTPRWIDRYWKSNASRHALPTHQTTPTSFLHSPHKETQLRGQVTLDTPHRLPPPPPKKSTSGTYGLGTRTSPPRVRSQRPTTPERPSYPYDPVPSMEEPRAPAQRIFIRPPPTHGQLMNLPTKTTAFSEPWQEDETQNASSPSPPTTRTTSTPSELPFPDDDGDDSILHPPPPSTRRPLNADGLDYECRVSRCRQRNTRTRTIPRLGNTKRRRRGTVYNLAAHNRVSMDVHLAATLR